MYNKVDDYLITVPYNVLFDKIGNFIDYYRPENYAQKHDQRSPEYMSAEIPA
jgi:hypothetical protein